MLGACTDCDQITDTEQYPHFFSICADCWEEYKAGAWEPRAAHSKSAKFHDRYGQGSKPHGLKPNRF